MRRLHDCNLGCCDPPLSRVQDESRFPFGLLIVVGLVEALLVLGCGAMFMKGRVIGLW